MDIVEKISGQDFVRDDLSGVMSKENKIKSVDFIKAFISFVFLFVVNVFFVLSGLLFVANAKTLYPKRNTQSNKE